MASPNRKVRRIDAPLSGPRYQPAEIPGAPVDFHAADRAANPGLPPRARADALTVARAGGATVRGVQTLRVAASVTLSEPELGTALISPDLGGGSMNWPGDGESRLEAWAAVTLAITSSSLAGGTVAWTINGSPASSPFVLAAGDVLSGVLSGASGSATVALQRTA